MLPGNVLRCCADFGMLNNRVGLLFKQMTAERRLYMLAQLASRRMPLSAIYRSGSLEIDSLPRCSPLIITSMLR